MTATPRCGRTLVLKRIPVTQKPEGEFRLKARAGINLVAPRRLDALPSNLRRTPQSLTNDCFQPVSASRLRRAHRPQPLHSCRSAGRCERQQRVGDASSLRGGTTTEMAPARWHEGCAVPTECEGQVSAARTARSGLSNQVVRPFMRSAIHDCTALSGHAAVRCPAFTDRGKMPLRICS